MKKLDLLYIDANTVNQYAYAPLPLMLVDDPAYTELGAAEKILYTLMLNRLSLSSRNNDRFTDKQGKLYIIYTVEQTMKSMNCSKSTAIRYLQRLTEIGLIERIRVGQGKPTRTYIKDFASVKFMQRQAANQEETEGYEIKPQVSSKIDFKMSQDETPKSSECELQEVSKSDPSKQDLSQPDYRNSIPQYITLGKRGNISLTEAQIEGLREDYGSRLEKLMDECSDRIFARGMDCEPIQNVYRYIQTIAKTLGYQTEAELKKTEIQKAELLRRKKEEEQAELERQLKEYGAADEEELNRMKRDENARNIEALKQKLQSEFKI